MVLVWIGIGSEFGAELGLRQLRPVMAGKGGTPKSELGLRLWCVTQSPGMRLRALKWDWELWDGTQSSEVWLRAYSSPRGWTQSSEMELITHSRCRWLIHAETSCVHLRLADASWGQLIPVEYSWGQPSPVEISWGQLRSAEDSWCQLKPDEASWGKLRPSEVSWSQLRLAEASWSQLRPIEASWGQLKYDETSWSQLRPVKANW